MFFHSTQHAELLLFCHFLDSNSIWTFSSRTARASTFSTILLSYSSQGENPSLLQSLPWLYIFLKSFLLEMVLSILHAPVKQQTQKKSTDPCALIPIFFSMNDLGLCISIFSINIPLCQLCATSYTSSVPCSTLKIPFLHIQLILNVLLSSLFCHCIFSEICIIAFDKN